MTKPLSYQIILFCHTDLSCHTETLHSKVKYLKILVILSLFLVILSRRRSIHEFKVRICILKYGFFILNSMDFSLCANTLRSK